MEKPKARVTQEQSREGGICSTTEGTIEGKGDG